MFTILTFFPSLNVQIVKQYHSILVSLPTLLPITSILEYYAGAASIKIATSCNRIPEGVQWETCCWCDNVNAILTLECSRDEIMQAVFFLLLSGQQSTPFCVSFILNYVPISYILKRCCRAQLFFSSSSLKLTDGHYYVEMDRDIYCLKVRH